MFRMMLALCVLAGVAGEVRSATLTGSWTAHVTDKDPERLQFMMHHRKNGQNGTTWDRTVFEGLTAAQVRSATQVPVTFAMKREAGTITYEGTFKHGDGAGQFEFVSNPAYLKSLRQLGLELEAKESDEQQLFALTLFDVSTEYIRSMQAIGYKVRLEKYIAFRIFKVDAAYVREMEKVGFKNLSADKLVETKIHGATPEYIREMRAAGQDLSLDDYIQSRIFQVTPEFKAEMSQAGYPGLDNDVLTQFRIHGVTTEFIRELRQLGYTKLAAQKLVEMRIHGVTPEFIRRVEAAGYRNVPVDKLVQMRIFNIEPEMVKELDKVVD